MLDVYPDYGKLCRAAAELFVEQAGSSIAARGAFHVVLSGGETPRQVYGLLAEAAYRDRIAWSGVHVYWSDERCVPPGDKLSNEGMVRLALLDHVPIPPEQIFPIRCQERPENAALIYEAVIRKNTCQDMPRFDLIFLGLGGDGHTASLFPFAPALDERARLACVADAAAAGLCRVTLTAPVINNARLIAFLVAGEGKAAALRDTLRGPQDCRRLPAQLIKPGRGELRWLVDKEAAAMLG